MPSLYMYHSLRKERPWAEHLTSSSKRGMGALLSVAACDHERVPTSCLQLLDAQNQLLGQTITYTGTTSNFEVKA